MLNNWLSIGNITSIFEFGLIVFSVFEFGFYIWIWSDCAFEADFCIWNHVQWVPETETWGLEYRLEDEMYASRRGEESNPCQWQKLLPDFICKRTRMTMPNWGRCRATTNLQWNISDLLRES